MNIESDTYIYPFIDAIKKIRRADKMGNEQDLEWNLNCAKRFATKSEIFKNYAGEPNMNNDSKFINQSIRVLEKINSNYEQKQYLITEPQQFFDTLISDLNNIK